MEFKIPKKSINPYFIAELTERVYKFCGQTDFGINFHGVQIDGYEELGPLSLDQFMKL